MTLDFFQNRDEKEKELENEIVEEKEIEKVNQDEIQKDENVGDADIETELPFSLEI